MAHTKLQLKTLSVLRALLRDVNARVDNRIRDPPVRDTSSFRRFIMNEYRAGAAISDRSEAKRRRAYAESVLAYTTAVAEQSSLISRYRGADADTPLSRRAAARFVGLEMPASTAGLPLARVSSDGSVAPSPPSAASRYADRITARIGDVSKLEGVENLKAQLYGPPGSPSPFVAPTARDAT